MPDTPFIPACPTCGYDLTGTPHDTCPECGTPFDRKLVWSGWYQRERSGWPRNWVLVASIVLGNIGWGFDRPHASAKSWAVFGLVWVLALAWVALRWRAIAGRKPWLVLWLVLVAAWAPNRPSFDDTEELIAQLISLGFVALALAFALIRDWRTGLRGVLYGVSAFAWISAAVFTVGPILSQTGITSRERGAGYTFIAWEFPAGGINDLIALAIAATSAAAGWTAWRAGRWIARPCWFPRTRT